MAIDVDAIVALALYTFVVSFLFFFFLRSTLFFLFVSFVTFYRSVFYYSLRLHNMRIVSIKFASDEYIV